MESHEGGNRFPTVHQRRSAYWNEESPEGLTKLDIKRIIERMTEKAILFTQKDKQGKTTELSLRYTTPVRGKIEVMAFVHEYSEIVEGVQVGGAEMLYIEANVSIKKLVPFADGMDKLIGKDRYEGMVKEVPKIKQPDYETKFAPGFYGGTPPDKYDRREEEKSSGLFYITMEFATGQNSGPLTGEFEASELSSVLEDLKKYIPLGSRDSQSRLRTAYVVHDAVTRVPVQRLKQS